MNKEHLLMIPPDLIRKNMLRQSIIFRAIDVVIAKRT